MATKTKSAPAKGKTTRSNPTRKVKQAAAKASKTSTKPSTKNKNPPFTPQEVRRIIQLKEVRNKSWADISTALNNAYHNKRSPGSVQVKYCRDICRREGGPANPDGRNPRVVRKRASKDTTTTPVQTPRKRGKKTANSNDQQATNGDNVDTSATTSAAANNQTTDTDNVAALSVTAVEVFPIESIDLSSPTAVEGGSIENTDTPATTVESGSSINSSGCRRSNRVRKATAKAKASASGTLTQSPAQFQSRLQKAKSNSSPVPTPASGSGVRVKRGTSSDNEGPMPTVDSEGSTNLANMFKAPKPPVAKGRVPKAKTATKKGKASKASKGKGKKAQLVEDALYEDDNATIVDENGTSHVNNEEHDTPIIDEESDNDTANDTSKSKNSTTTSKPTQHNGVSQTSSRVHINQIPAYIPPTLINNNATQPTASTSNAVQPTFHRTWQTRNSTADLPSGYPVREPENIIFAQTFAAEIQSPLPTDASVFFASWEPLHFEGDRPMTYGVAPSGLRYYTGMDGYKKWDLYGVTQVLPHHCHRFPSITKNMIQGHVPRGWVVTVNQYRNPPHYRLRKRQEDDMHYPHGWHEGDKGPICAVEGCEPTGNPVQVAQLGTSVATTLEGSSRGQVSGNREGIEERDPDVISAAEALMMMSRV